MMLTRCSKAVLFAGVALFPVMACAQSTDTTVPPVPPAAAAADSAPANTGEIVITGSRIARPDFQAPNPIISFSAANIEQSGNTNLTNFLQRVPALTGSSDSTVTSGGNGTYNKFGTTGLNELNLRNLGTSRTLVLVDGRRHVAGELNTAAVDINTIPTDLIQRVDVLTGAISAVYGADGVTGVVNFILKRDFDGVSGRFQSGVSDYGDAGNRFISLAAGKNFAGGRGNITLAYEYSRDEAVTNDERPFLRSDQRKYLIPNDAYTGQPNVPQNILVGDLRYGNESPIGAVYIGNETTPRFDGLGRPYDNGTAASYYQTGGVSTKVAGFYQGDLYPLIERHDVNLLSHYDFSDAFKLSVEGTYAQSHTRSFGQYTSTYGGFNGTQPISINNPFVPAVIRDAAIASGATGVFVNRDNIDYGRQGEDDLRKTYRGVIDGSGRLSDHATWDAYYEYGETDVRITKLNDRLNAQYAQALDAVRDPATGQIVCNPANNPGPGCVPISLFGPGPATAKQLAYFLVNDTSTAKITQQVASASISGDFGQYFKLPGGPVKFAFGGEYRRETSQFNPNQRLVDAVFFSGDEPVPVSPSSGKFDVKEAFGELDLPILKDVPFAYILSVGAAGRYSHYSTSGNTTTWQFNGTYAPVPAITFRGSYGKAVRAPNIGELFQPKLGDNAFFTDPCTPAQIKNGTQYRMANCTATLAAVGATSQASLQTDQFVFGSSSGNINLKPETARTWTAGVLVRPSFLRGFVASFDWYNINLKDAINTIDASTLASLCVDQPTVPNQYCNQFTRAQGTGIINNYTRGPLNVARFQTAGLDVNLDYVVRAGNAGMFDLRLVVGYLNKLDMVGIPGAPVINSVDQSYAPRWTADFSPTWTIGQFVLNYNLRWKDATLAYDRNTLAASPNVAAPQYLRFSALWQHDIQAKLQVNKDFSFYGGVTNFTNQKPDLYSYTTNIPISPLGRYFYAGAKFNLGSSARK
ncbi:TonB-dependent receptor plug domain-containing protein [Novosphingobium sp.]|uniref:TonB-dependent receptor plug domain-containing protein n=1 Tax=Novosphingobium sp. TaxID=1874826 RepID=UPI003B51F6AA